MFLNINCQVPCQCFPFFLGCLSYQMLTENHHFCISFGVPGLLHGSASRESHCQHWWWSFVAISIEHPRQRSWDGGHLIALDVDVGISNTVDGRHPAPVDMVNIPLFKGWRLTAGRRPKGAMLALCWRLSDPSGPYVAAMFTHVSRMFAHVGPMLV